MVMVEILYKLGWDQTFWLQLGIILILFVLLKKIFFNKLQHVLDEREAKTQGLVGQANEILHKAEKLEYEYHLEIEKAYEEAQDYLRTNKEKWIEEERVIYQKTEEEVNKDFETKRNELENEFHNKKEILFKETEGLAEKFVQKLS